MDSFLQISEIQAVIVIVFQRYSWIRPTCCTASGLVTFWWSWYFLSFPREHFPFFQTAPDGWKNTIRHNLCFNSSFRKTCNQLCRDGKRKSCFWHLTLDGQRRLMDEIHMLTGESLKQLQRSMSHPGKWNATLITPARSSTWLLTHWQWLYY